MGLNVATIKQTLVWLQQPLFATWDGSVIFNKIYCYMKIFQIVWSTVTQICLM